jgi:hypothetical protein
LPLGFSFLFATLLKLRVSVLANPKNRKTEDAKNNLSFSILEINRRHHFAQAAPKFGNLRVFRMDRIGIERSSVVKDCNQTGIERTRQMERVESDC